MTLGFQQLLARKRNEMFPSLLYENEIIDLNEHEKTFQFRARLMGENNTVGNLASQRDNLKLKPII